MDIWGLLAPIVAEFVNLKNSKQVRIWSDTWPIATNQY